MKDKTTYLILCLSVLMFCSGCSKSMIKGPLLVSNERWSITLEALALGPDQYNTAGGFWQPMKSRHFLWATLSIRNGLKTGQQFLLGMIVLTAGGKKVKPFILDMNSIVTLRANPAPRLEPGETISRRLIYILPEGVIPEKITYENTEIGLPAVR